jgi:hypothetical protein
MVVEAFAEIGGKSVDHAAQLEQRVTLGGGGECPHGGAHGLRLGPAV